MAHTTQKWVIFRETNDFVTPGTNQVSVTQEDPGQGVFPLARTIDGDAHNVGFGANPQYRDRDAGADPRFAGIAFFANDGNSEQPHSVDGLAAGDYAVRVIAGDPLNDRPYMEWRILDDDEVRETIIVDANTPGEQWRDATGALRVSNAAYLAGNLPLTVTIASGILRVLIGSVGVEEDVTPIAAIGWQKVVTGVEASGDGATAAASAPAGSAAAVTVKITGFRLIDKFGAPVANLTGATALIYKTTPATAVAPDKVITNVTTNGSGILMDLDLSNIQSNASAVWLTLLKDGSPDKATTVKVIPTVS